jgi:hypothetical protein
LEVKAEFGIELGFQLLTLAKPLPPVHWMPPSAASRINPIAADSRFQFSVSDLS